MRPFGTLIPFKEAKGITGANIEPITRTEAVGIDDCLDRVLAEDIVATQSTPPFNRAAMDGYALKSGDTLSVSPKNPGLLNIIDVLHAGSVPTKRVSQGECIQIATGAIIPPGADAVVKIEDVIKENSQIKVKGPVKVKNHVALMGEDINYIE